MVTHVEFSQIKLGMSWLVCLKMVCTAYNIGTAVASGIKDKIRGKERTLSIVSLELGFPTLHVFRVLPSTEIRVYLFAALQSPDI
jgi:hypothetical protein